MNQEHENGEPAPEITELRAQVASLTEATQTLALQAVAAEHLAQLWAANVTCDICPGSSFCKHARKTIGDCADVITEYAVHIHRQTTT